MPIFEIEKDGKVFEIDAPDQNAAVAAFQQYSSPAEKPRIPNAQGLGMGQGFTLGWGDEIYAAGTAPIRAIGGLFTGEGYDLGKAYNEGLQSIREVHGLAQEQDPVGYGVGEVAGGLSLGGSAARSGLTLMNAAKPTVASMGGRGAAEGAIYGGIGGAGAADGDLADRGWGAAEGALIGGSVGGALGGATGALAGRAANKAVPSVEELKAQAGELYDLAEATGVTFSRNTVKTLADDISAKVISEGIDQTLHPRATAALKRLQEQAGKGMTVKEAQTMRRILSTAGRDPTNPDEARIASMMIDEFDNLVSRQVPELAEARSLYQRAKKGEIIEGAIEQAGIRASQFSGSGFENALRTEFRQLARMIQKGQLKGLSEAEKAAIRKVAMGGPLSNIARWMGKLAPTGVVSLGMSGGVPFMIGNALGNPVAGAVASGATMAAGMAGRKAAETLTRRAAAAASDMARRGTARPAQPLTQEQLQAVRALIAAGGAEAEELPIGLRQMLAPVQ